MTKITKAIQQVTPREGRVSRNSIERRWRAGISVTPREGRVSRNWDSPEGLVETKKSRPARGV